MDQQDISWIQIRYDTLESGVDKPSLRNEFVKQPNENSPKPTEQDWPANPQTTQ